MSLKEVLASVKSSFLFTKVVEIKGIKYGLSVLSMGQEKKVNAYLDTINQEDSLEYLNELRRAVISESIVSINAETIGKVVKDTDAAGNEVEKDKAIYIKEMLSDFPTTIVTELFDAYIDIKEESENILKKEMKYDWFKSPEQREKEAAEETKKEEALKVPAAEEKTVAATALTEEVKLSKVTESKSDEVPQ
jgi:hypothetical protein